MEFTLPKKFNGETLRNELKAEGIILPENKKAITVSGEVLILDIDEKDATKVQNVLANHNGDDILIEETVADKLASVGLSIEELKTALGGN